MPGIEPWSAACKTNTLLITLLLCPPPSSYFVYLFIYLGWQHLFTWLSATLDCSLSAVLLLQLLECPLYELEILSLPSMGVTHGPFQSHFSLLFKCMHPTMICAMYLNTHRTHSDFRSWLSCRDPRGHRGSGKSWNCRLHGYVHYVASATHLLCRCTFLGLDTMLWTPGLAGPLKSVYGLCKVYVKT